VKPRHHYDGVTAIEGLEKALPFARIVGGNGIGVCGIEEGVVVDHVVRHVVGPFEDLWSNIDHKSIRGPSAEDYYFGDRVIHEEKGHGGAGAN
jgi:hypothetical protein